METFSEEYWLMLSKVADALRRTPGLLLGERHALTQLEKYLNEKA